MSMFRKELMNQCYGWHLCFYGKGPCIPCCNVDYKEIAFISINAFGDGGSGLLSFGDDVCHVVWSSEEA